MKIKNKIMLLMAGVITILMYSTTTSHAALQANGKSTKTDTLDNWLLNIRKMEATGGTLGLSDTINTTNLTSSASESNNLDIHMELNTEYGAMAILSASSYGNPNKINSGGTTTGNKTGVYIKKQEVVSAGVSSQNENSKMFNNVVTKYKNIYSSRTAVKIGDAMKETTNWHGGTGNSWYQSTYMTVLIRGGTTTASYTTIFDYGNISSIEDCCCRAVIVVGERTLKKCKKNNKGP